MIATVGRNIVANVAGTGLGVVAFLLVIPVYLRLLGAEGYGLVGLLTTLTIAAAALDLGLGATMNREAARMTTQPGDSGRLADVAATLPAASWAVGIVAGALFVSLAPAIASRWLTFSELSLRDVRTALELMGAVLPALIVRGVYVGALNGLQRQGTVNVVQASGVAIRGGASITALLAVAPTATVFLVVQLVLFYAEVGVLAAMLRRSLPFAARGGRIRLEAIRPLLPFSAGMAGTMLLGLALTSMDQIILSAILPLAEFGYYTLAVSVAAALGQIVGPVTTAVFPRFSQLFERGEIGAAVAEYHFISQVVASLVLPLTALLVFFPDEVLSLWTGNARLARDAALVLSLRAIGTVLNALLHVPHVVQLASGWSTLGAGVNAVAALAMAPIIVGLSLWWGGPGAALAWVVLNLGVLILFMSRMHRRVWPGELTAWYLHVLRPAAAVSAVSVVALLGRVMMPPALGPLARLGWLTTTGVLAAAAAISVAPTLRHRELAVLRPS